MMIPLEGGPYAGRRIWASHLMQHTTVLSLRSATRTWRFLYLPDPRDWQAVLNGRLTIDQSEQRHYYQLLSTAQGPRLRFDPKCEAYWEAMQEALRDMPNRDGQARNRGKGKRGDGTNGPA